MKHLKLSVLAAALVLPCFGLSTANGQELFKAEVSTRSVATNGSGGLSYSHYGNRQIIADAAAAAGVAVTGAIILATGGWYWLDPAVALVIAVVVAYHAFALIRKVLTRLRPATADTEAGT